jgi:hypothetical protein
MKNNRFSYSINLYEYPDFQRGRWTDDQEEWFIDKLADNLIEQGCTAQEIVMEIHKLFYYISGLSINRCVSEFTDDVIANINSKRDYCIANTPDLRWNYWLMPVDESKKVEKMNLEGYTFKYLSRGALTLPEIEENFSNES